MFVFSLMAIVFWYCLQMVSEGTTQEIA